MHEAFRVCISSPPDREKLVAEIFVGNEQIAELSQEHSDLEIEVYPRRDGKAWFLGFNDLMGALTEAQRRLTGRQ